MDDMTNVRMYMTTGYALADIKVWATDMDGNELTESPWSWLAFSTEVFTKVKPAKTKKSYRNKYHYSFTVDAEPPKSLHPLTAMDGTISIVDASGMKLSWSLSQEGLLPKTVGLAGKNQNDWDELTQEAKHEFADKWDGTMTVTFNAKYLLELVNAQNGEDDSEHVALTVNVYNQLTASPPMMIVTSNLSSIKPELNVGFLMPVMSKVTEFKRKSLDYLKDKTAKRLQFGDIAKVKSE
jgi:hypothetical protein